MAGLARGEHSVGVELSPKGFGKSDSVQFLQGCMCYLYVLGLPYRQGQERSEMNDDYDGYYDADDYNDVSDNYEYMLDWARREGNFDYTETPDWSQLLKK